MKKNIFLTLSILFLGFYAFAQKEVKLKTTSKVLVLNLTSVVVEGYSGSEVVFSKEVGPEDKRAEGLTRITSTGIKDNTGLGLSTDDSNGILTVHSLENDFFSKPVKIMVPEQMKIVLIESSSIGRGDIVIDNMKSELEISVSNGNIKLGNNSGPINAKSINGDMSAVFKDLMKGPISLVTMHGKIDVSMPQNAKANVEMATTHGKIYASDRFNMVVETQPAKTPTPTVVPNLTKTDGKYNPAQIQQLATAIAGNMRDVVKGKIGGGGADIILKSNFSAIYLRAN